MDIFWLRDETLEESDNLSDPASEQRFKTFKCSMFKKLLNSEEIAEDLETALEPFSALPTIWTSTRLDRALKRPSILKAVQTRREQQNIRKQISDKSVAIGSQATIKQTESGRPQISASALFLTFSRISLSGFGGVMFWSRRALVERRRWLTEREFVDLLTLGQLLPGPNVLNLTVMVGYRFGGWTGAAAAVAGFLGWPCLVVIGMGVLYQQYGALPQVQRALAGMSIVAAGLLLSTVIKLAMVLPRRWRPWLFGMLAFVGVGVMRWPLLWVMGALAPWAVLAAWKESE